MVLENFAFFVLRTKVVLALEGLIWLIQNDAKKADNLLKPWHMGTHL